MSILSRAQSLFFIPPKNKREHIYPLAESLYEKLKKNESIHRISRSSYTDIIKDFREKTYSQRAPYLLGTEHLDLINEVELNERSYHFLGESKETILSTLRLTPYPFEITALFPQLDEQIQKNFSNYIELSRLISKNREQTLFLFMQAALFAQKMGYTGFISICSPKNYQKFKKFGLQAYGEALEISYRNNQKYYIISANFTRLNSLGLMAYYHQKILGNVL